MQQSDEMTHGETADPLAGNACQLAWTVEDFKAQIRNHLVRTLGLTLEKATESDWWTAVCYSVRDGVLERGTQAQRVHDHQNVRRVYYLSLEYLMGRLLENSLVSVGLLKTARAALEELGQDPEAIINHGPDLGLGNGGLGRLAACFMDSLSTLDFPAVGYGIFYEFGLFRQSFVGGRQVEHPDAWRRLGSPWEIRRPDRVVEVRLYGRVEHQFDDLGQGRSVWVDTRSIIGMPCDIPVPGYGCTTVNYLRLWEARASKDFDLDAFNSGGYDEAVKEKVLSETISKVLYPNDATEAGKELRLVQQYFFVACSLRDILRRHRRLNADWDTLPDKAAVQLNDTHPTLAVVELIRILIDEIGMEWEKAWDICQRTFSYTNHTLLPEALERWSVPLFEKVLPRHLQIIYRINDQFLNQVVAKQWPGEASRLRELSIIEEGAPKMVRMAYLAVIGSHTTNGVAALHTELLKKHLFQDFYTLYPDRFQNKTNGITPRRWLKACNPGLSAMLNKVVGPWWPADLDLLRQIEPLAEDPAWCAEYMKVKRANKVRLAEFILQRCGVEVNPDALFDVQIKRLHEYKRQHLNLLHIVHLYRQLLRDPHMDIPPRVFVFAAKAAPGYVLAKEIIHAINSVASKINSDERIHGKLKVIFLPNYGVSVAEYIIPAADLSEQISTAGKEASGTGNMKLALNGALTIGTLDGANVEIRDAVGEDNIFIFGLTVEQVEALWATGYSPYDYYWASPELKETIDWLCSDYFSGERGAFDHIRRSLLDGGDPYLVLADFQAYCDKQEEVGRAYQDQATWARKAVLNTARMGWFSSDRTIREYAKDIWKISPVPIS